MDKKGRNRYQIKQGKKKIQLIADDIQISNLGDLVFRTRPDPQGGKMEIVASYKRKKWDNVVRTDVNGEPVVLLSDEEE